MVESGGALWRADIMMLAVFRVQGRSIKASTTFPTGRFSPMPSIKRSAPGGIKRTDEMRRAREEMDSASYRDMTYYERWIASIETILIEKKILTREEIDRKLAEFDSKWGEP
ncbi:MAG: nitrile hydratase subunit beta [Deltaproteobacteria bacterium]|nr:MAG: nitrile hydratase subunit beta [Deltaproteobacteria bacterium]